jgi:hypothetical protein
MGIRSPRLLERFALRITVAFVALLGCAPSALAGNGVLPPVSAPLSTPTLPPLPATVNVATPPVTAPLQVTLPTGAGSSSPSPKSTATPASVIAARQVHDHVLSSNERGAPAQRETHATPLPQLTTLRASTTAGSAPRTSRAFLLPLQTRSGIAGTSSGGSPSALPFVLFVLAAALAAIAVPGLGRRLQLFIRAPRPYRCLLELERPD